MTALRSVLLLALAVGNSFPGTALPAVTNVCSFGGPTPGWRATQITVPAGTEVQLRLTGPPPTTVGSANSSHFVQAIGVIDIATGRLVGAAAGSWGATGRSLMVRSGGDTLTQHEEPLVVRPPVVRRSPSAVPPLRAGRYLVLAFGVDGSRALPNPPWGAELRVGPSASVTCGAVGSGELIDVDHTAFQGGTQLSASDVTVTRDSEFRWNTRREFVFEVVQATAWPAGSARVLAALPDGRSLVVEDDIVPLATHRGSQILRADAQGPATVIVAGVAITR